MAKKKFERKKKSGLSAALDVILPSAPVETESGDWADDDFNDLMESAQKSVKGLFVPDDEHRHLLEVKDWIRMPAPICEALGGIPGLPCGLITMVYGKKDSGKTTLAIEALSSAQADGGIAILIDTENKFNLKRAAAMGVNVKRLFIIPAVSIEQAFDKALEMVLVIRNKVEYVNKANGEVVSSSHFDKLTDKEKKSYESRPMHAGRKICIVWDSLGGTPSDAELAKDGEEFAMVAAKIIKGRLRKMVRFIKDMKLAFVIINHVYNKPVSFGKKTTPYGGEGPEYYSSLILEFTKLGRVRDGKDGPFIATKAMMEAVKNHIAQPFLEAELLIDWRGFVIDREPEEAPKGYFYGSGSVPTATT